jgi:hypothetical protein
MIGRSEDQVCRSKISRRNPERAKSPNFYSCGYLGRLGAEGGCSTLVHMRSQTTLRHLNTEHR